MSLVMGARTPHLLARACDLGVAMQLTNIARDVGEDAREGRIYLPLEWLRAAHIDPDAWTAKPVFNDAIGALVQRLLVEADILYARSCRGISGLPLACRPGTQQEMLRTSGRASSSFGSSTPTAQLTQHKVTPRVAVKCYQRPPAPWKRHKLGPGTS